MTPANPSLLAQATETTQSYGPTSATGADQRGSPPIGHGRTWASATSEAPPSRSQVDEHLGPADPAPVMVGIRELARSVSAVIAGVVESGRLALVTKHGQPCAAIVPISESQDAISATVGRRLGGRSVEDVRAGRTHGSREAFIELGRLADALASATALADPDAASLDAGS